MGVHDVLPKLCSRLYDPALEITAIPFSSRSESSVERPDRSPPHLLPGFAAIEPETLRFAQLRIPHHLPCQSLPNCMHLSQQLGHGANVFRAWAEIPCTLVFAFAV